MFFTSEPFLWIIAILMTAGLIFFAVYFLVSLTDLESDFLNPIEACSRANTWVLPEAGLHIALSLLFLVLGYPVEFFVQLPLIMWNVRAYLTDTHLYDATRIFEHMPRHKKVNMVKLGFFMLFFFVDLYRLIVSLIGKKRR